MRTRLILGIFAPAIFAILVIAIIILNQGNAKIEIGIPGLALGKFEQCDNAAAIAAQQAVLEPGGSEELASAVGTAGAAAPTTVIFSDLHATFPLHTQRCVWVR